MAVMGVALFATQVAHVQPRATTARAAVPIKATPQAVVIGENVDGTMKTAKVLVTNVSKEAVHVNVLSSASWFRVSQPSVDLDPGKTTVLDIVGNLSALKESVTLPTREGQAVEVDKRPIAGFAPVTLSTGQAATVFVVFGVRMENK
jgi:hypothetical protein